MNKHSGRLSLYLVLIVALIAGYFYLNNQVATQSDYTMGQLEQALEDGKVYDEKIHQNSEVPTGSVVVSIKDEGQKRVYVADVKEAEHLLRENGIDPEPTRISPNRVYFLPLFFRCFSHAD